MDKINTNHQQTIISSAVRRGTSILALNCAHNRLIAAGQQNFQLFSIEQIDQTEQFRELYDFRNTSRPSAIPRYALQPKDVSWSPHDENCFATASSTCGHLYTWDINRLDIVNQMNLHSTIINRTQFHPKHPYMLLTASQDGSAKLTDCRINDNGRVVTTFRHMSKEGFRDIDINISNTDKFAAAISDQYSVPIWDIRQPAQPEFSVLTRDKVLCVAWNPHERSWLATGGTGGHDRTIRVWDAKGNDNRQDPLFTVYTFGQVTKFSWRPTCRYHIASFTRTSDQHIHVWDIRRAYLPHATFCHHRNDIGDFIWRSNSDNIISVDRDDCLIHAHLSSAIKSDQVTSLFSLDVTSKGSVHISIPNIDNDYVRSLYNERHIPSSTTSLQKFYSQETISTFLKWNKVIEGKSILGIYSNTLHDNSVQLFHQFARRWIFGNGDKSIKALVNICNINGDVADKLNRPDLKATWEVIKLLYDDSVKTKDHRHTSSKRSRSGTKSFHRSDSRGSHYQQTGRRPTNIDKQKNRLNEELNNNDKKEKLQDHRKPSNSKLMMIDDTDTYIVRDVLTDDIIFISPEDLANNDNVDDMPYGYNFDHELKRDSFSIPLLSDEMLQAINTDDDYNIFSTDRITRQFPEVMMIEDGVELESDDGCEDIDNNMQVSTYSINPDGSDEFLTIDDSYSLTIQNQPLNFDQIIGQTLWYYIENNELQVAVHLLLALYPQFTEYKRKELFNGAHLQWLVMYIELLQKMRLFVKAKQVTKHCIENEGIPLNYNTNEFDGSIILNAQTSTLKRVPSVNPLPTTSSSSNSKNLSSNSKDFICSICRIPCRVLFTFCGICFHGGHIDHITAWFKTHDECSHGCGHLCKDYHNQKYRTRITQRLISKPSSNTNK
ncbi:unnamed protein product [Adineta steineri]|uniref:GATOR2 complex protein WDR24 n=1 Tax=Adineta steineri TaxID=433720 RepID=A0A815JMP4_9BILA|nr:unnamed protein product [Adineta steineri]